MTGGLRCQRKPPAGDLIGRFGPVFFPSTRCLESGFLALPLTPFTHTGEEDGPHRQRLSVTP